MNTEEEMTNFVLNSQDADFYSDLFKSVYGFRPRGPLINFPSQERFDEEVQCLIDESNLQLEQEERDFKAALERYETRIDGLMKSFSLTRKDAIRWDMQAEGHEEWDMDAYLYYQGLNCSDSNRIMEEFKS
jgi:hypothetical protein